MPDTIACLRVALADHHHLERELGHADPELQPYVREAKERLARVVGEPR
ncbi:MAG TPA: hypothetical protein VFU40_00450 [Gemmatimonadales bacterium]|nr:hypothetical protein [Gemmatimonadales bacterium]